MQMKEEVTHHSKKKGSILPRLRTIALLSGVGAIAGLYFYPVAAFVIAKALLSDLLSSFVAPNFLALVTSLSANAAVFLTVAGSSFTFGKVLSGIASCFSRKPAVHREASLVQEPANPEQPALVDGQHEETHQENPEPVVHGSPTSMHRRTRSQSADAFLQDPELRPKSPSNAA